jgi:adenine-specific DNA-methyltransferase
MANEDWGRIEWPRNHKKPNALKLIQDAQKWFLPRGAYIVVKGFSAKNGRRKITAYAIEPTIFRQPYYAFEHNLKVINSRKQGIGEDLARGIALFLNSTIADQHFSSFSGQRRVHVADLRHMRFPSKETLAEFGRWATSRDALGQEAIDTYVESFHAK